MELMPAHRMTGTGTMLNAALTGLAPTDEPSARISQSQSATTGTERQLPEAPAAEATSAARFKPEAEPDFKPSTVNTEHSYQVHCAGLTVVFTGVVSVLPRHVDSGMRVHPPSDKSTKRCMLRVYMCICVYPNWMRGGGYANVKGTSLPACFAKMPCQTLHDLEASAA